MWLGRFASVMVAPSALLIVTVKPALAGAASGAVPAVPQAPRRAAPAAARNGAMPLAWRSRGDGFIRATSLALVALRCSRIGHIPAAMVHLALGCLAAGGLPLTRAGGMGDAPRIGLLARRSSLLAAFPRPNASVADSQPLPADSCATAPDLHRLPVHPWAFHLYQQYMAPDETSMVWRVSPAHL